MEIRCCCQSASPDHAAVSVPSTWASRCFDLTSGIVSLGVLILMPKCPACLAAYVALGTGIGLSFSTATYLRTAAIVICTLSLAILAAKTSRRLARTILAKA